MKLLRVKVTKQVLDKQLGYNPSVLKWFDVMSQINPSELHRYATTPLVVECWPLDALAAMHFLNKQRK